MVSKEIVDAYVKQVASRALQRALKLKARNIMASQVIKPSENVWVKYAFPKESEQGEWIPAKATATSAHYFEVKDHYMEWKARVTQ